MRRHRRLHLQRRHRRERGSAPPRSRRPRGAAERQPHRQLAVDPRLPAPPDRAPRVCAGRRLAGGDRGSAGDRRLRGVQGGSRAAAQRPAPRGPHLGVDVGVAYFSWIDTDMVRGAERSHPGFAAMREGLRGPAGKTLPVGDAADAIVRGVQRRSRRVVAPGFVGALYRLRGLVPELIDREALKSAPDVDQLRDEAPQPFSAPTSQGRRPGASAAARRARSRRRHRPPAASCPPGPRRPSAGWPRTRDGCARRRAPCRCRSRRSRPRRS